MGLDAFNVAPDNKGGRKDSSTSSSGNRKNKGAMTLENDSKEYWEKLVMKHAGGERPEGQRMAAICGEAQVRPGTVRSKLHEHGIFEYEEIRKRELEESGLEPDTDSNLVKFVHDAK